ncbi:siderophore-interacting protein [Agrobacterium salinitolerans]|uniref:siderophore-interacting protein n=1 Tax=Agrobacterium salinitolerans TaxID=1183413 RepID=UPI00157494F2|nr:siderophore-interacting protein [Agrobacterium salinitolerans]NTA40270.1 siderophore-interacting protein [Agrobacterium salinitolerans]
MVDNKQSEHVDTPSILRVHHDLNRRKMTVATVNDITPNMRRIVLSGDDLADFVSLAPDDHIKVVVPDRDGVEQRRDYTPRRYDRQARSLVIDFALHEGGPATRWAINANPGATLEIIGPRGSAVVSTVVKRWLLIGDETALPAIGRRIEESDRRSEIDVVAAVAGAQEEQLFETAAALKVRWIHRSTSEATNPSPLISALRHIDIEPQTFIWIAAEASVTRAIRSYLADHRHHPLGWIKAAGYWTKVAQLDASSCGPIM